LIGVIPTTGEKVLAAGEIPGASSATSPSAASDPSPVIAYYFHRTIRCETCLTMEAWAKEALDLHFEAELKAGRLVWRPIDFELAPNAHYEEEFSLESSSLVLVGPGESGASEPRNLEAVWDLVGDRRAYFEYVRKSVAEFLARAERASGD
jgi:hypothetical protein